MIDFVQGTVAEKEIAAAVIDVHGVGYAVAITLATYERLPPIGAEVKLFTHYHVREDAQKLYGFFTRAERDLFRLLIGVNSVGPKTAIGILSKISADDLVRCLVTGDAALLTKIPGIGAKTAQRMIIDLRGKFKGATAVAGAAAGLSRPAGGAPSAGEEAFEALLSLGYAEKQVERAIARVKQTAPDAAMPVEEWIKKALQVI